MHLLGGEGLVAAAQGAVQRSVQAPAQVQPLPASSGRSTQVEAFVPALVPVARFIGTWIGVGAGEYPTVKDFAYSEEIELRPVPGKAMLAYRSATKAAEDGRPIHGESGWLRVVGEGAVELVIAQGPGLVEISEGFVEEGEILLSSTLIAGSSSAKPVTATERRYRVDGDTLRYEVAMAAVGVPLTHHLQARLTRSS